MHCLLLSFLKLSYSQFHLFNVHLNRPAPRHEPASCSFDLTEHADDMIMRSSTRDHAIWYQLPCCFWNSNVVKLASIIGFRSIMCMYNCDHLLYTLYLLALYINTLYLYTCSKVPRWTMHVTLLSGCTVYGAEWVMSIEACTASVHNFIHHHLFWQWRFHSGNRPF